MEKFRPNSTIVEGNPDAPLLHVAIIASIDKFLNTPEDPAKTVYTITDAISDTFYDTILEMPGYKTVPPLAVLYELSKNASVKPAISLSDLKKITDEMLSDASSDSWEDVLDDFALEIAVTIISSELRENMSDELQEKINERERLYKLQEREPEYKRRFRDQ